MVVILPPSDTNNILQMLSDPKAVKANILELQGMSEQAQRDQKKAYEERNKLLELKKDLEDKEVLISNSQSELDSREQKAKAYEFELIKASSNNAIKATELNQLQIDVISSQKDLAEKEKNLSLREKALVTAQNILNQGVVKLAQDQKAHDEWQLSISSILSSKP
jgi:hypothetical protein